MFWKVRASKTLVWWLFVRCAPGGCCGENKQFLYCKGDTVLKTMKLFTAGPTLYWTTNLVVQVFKMLANINKNVISVCPPDS